MRYRDRAEAGRLLGEKLAPYRGRADTIVLGLPRGGIPVAEQIAVALGAPLDVFVVRKLGVPWQEELAMGAIAAGNVRVLSLELIRELGIAPEAVEAVAQREEREVERRERLYRGERPPPELKGKTVILVDDGLATGSTMRAAILAVKQRDPAAIVVAVPVAAASSCEELRPLVTDLVCPLMPEPFHAVGQWYEDFSQTTDEEIHEILRRADERRGSIRPGAE
jgi:putative phosphoribosyl transferase